MTLRERRLKTGLRQEDVARVLEVDQTAVSYWENGKTKPLNKHKKRLARLYGCSVDELMADTSA